MSPPVWYTGLHLDRASMLRKDRTWVSAHLESPATRIAITWRSRNLIHRLDPSAPAPFLVPRSAAEKLIEAAAEVVFLGLDRGQALFSLDLSPLEETDVIDLAGGGALIDLRRVGPLMAAAEAATLAYARGIAHWHQ